MAATLQTTFLNVFPCMKLWISIKISRNFVPKGPIGNVPALFQIMTPTRRHAIISTNGG